MNSIKHNTGRLEVITGCMFSGKTEEMIARLRAAASAGRYVRAIKHRIDDRYDPDHLVTHADDKFDAIRIPAADAIPDAAGDADVIAIDEGHFFGRRLIDIVKKLLAENRRIIIAGLENDAWGRPFTPMPELAELADEVVYKHAPCRVCGGQARYSQRMVPWDDKLVVGGVEMYEPRCVKCFEPLTSTPPELD